MDFAEMYLSSLNQHYIFQMDPCSAYGSDAVFLK